MFSYHDDRKSKRGYRYIYSLFQCIICKAKILDSLILCRKGIRKRFKRQSFLKVLDFEICSIFVSKHKNFKVVFPKHKLIWMKSTCFRQRCTTCNFNQATNSYHRATKVYYCATNLWYLSHCVTMCVITFTNYFVPLFESWTLFNLTHLYLRSWNFSFLIESKILKFSRNFQNSVTDFEKKKPFFFPECVYSNIQTKGNKTKDWALVQNMALVGVEVSLG